MPSSLLISEPHPTVAANSYVHSGRGGAGNTFRASAASFTATAPTPVAAPRQTKRFYSGIGGAGNAHRANERPVLSFDEEFDRAKLRERATAGHVGVGGAGNIYRRKDSDASDTSSRRDSDSSHATSGFWGRLSSSSFVRHHSEKN